METCYKWLKNPDGLKTRYIPVKDKVLMPGDPEREYKAERMEKGIPLLDAVVADLQLLAEKFSLDLQLNKSL
jgi:LDH2 family malate/lactate/ureidoglycolate dehydrogenase